MATPITRMKIKLNEFEGRQARCDFLPKHGVQYPKKGGTISRLPDSNVGVPILVFKVGLRLLTTNLFDEIMHQYGFYVDDLTPNVFNRIVGFEMAC